MTETEAKTKCCPMLWQSSVIIAAAFDKITQLEGNGHYCIGSACMMWRWGEKTFTDNEYRAANYGANPSGTQHGYCGLAGKP